jgi:hypothetical protein
MTSSTESVDAKLHRKIAIDLFNHTWALIERQDRTPDDDAEMVNAAHTSRWHWSRSAGCEPKNLAIAEWQISHVYAISQRAEPARHHARQSLQICRKHGLGDYLLAYAYEALARGAAVAGDDVDCEEWLEKAWAAAQEVGDPQTRERLETDLGSVRSR